jgi:5-methylcytosine-specific restriction endonuclease McrA
MPNADYGQEWYRVRARVLRRDGYRCVVCGADVTGKHRARVDHIVPVKVDPARIYDLTNLRTLCPRCDAARHAEKGGGAEKPETGLDGYRVGW